MPTGTVVRFDRRRGYGFIQPDDQGEDVFVHQNNIQMEGFRFLDVGERVAFELEVGDKGMKAVSVTLTEPRKPRADGDTGGGYGQDQGGQGSYGNDRGGDRGGYGERDAYAPPARREPREPRAPRAAPAGDDRSKRKLERLISILVEKGLIAPGEIDGVEQSAAVAQSKGI